MLHDTRINAACGLIEATLEKICQEEHIPGLSAAIVHDQDVLWSVGIGYADLETQVPATSSTLYHIGSIGKLFTATMLMQLRDCGLLHLDDPFAHHLPIPALSQQHPVYRLTFRQAVSHLTGLPLNGNTAWEIDEKVVRAPALEALLADLAEIDLLAAPMSEFRYSNIAVALMGQALAAIAAEPYSAYIKRNMLQPLGMSMTSDEITEDLRPYLATGYKPLQEQQHVPAPLCYSGGMAAAGTFYSSVEDMAKFATLQFRTSGEGDQAVLSGQTLREMHAPVFFCDREWRQAIATGWFLERLHNQTTIGHSGGIFGFGSDLLLVPSLKLGLIVLTNVGSSVTHLTRIMLELLLPTWERVQTQQKHKAQENIPAEWKCYEGSYTEAGLQQTIHVQWTVTTLKWVDAGFEAMLAVEKPHVFRVHGGPADGERLTFVVDEQGVVAAIRAASLLFERQG